MPNTSPHRIRRNILAAAVTVACLWAASGPASAEGNYPPDAGDGRPNSSGVIPGSYNVPDNSPVVLDGFGGQMQVDTLLLPNGSPAPSFNLSFSNLLPSSEVNVEIRVPVQLASFVFDGNISSYSPDQLQTLLASSFPAGARVVANNLVFVDVNNLPNFFPNPLAPGTTVFFFPGDAASRPEVLASQSFALLQLAFNGRVPGSWLSVFLNSEPLELVTVQVDEYGNIGELNVPVPDGVEPGAHSMTVVSDYPVGRAVVGPDGRLSAALSLPEDLAALGVPGEAYSAIITGVAADGSPLRATATGMFAELPDEPTTSTTPDTAPPTVPSSTVPPIVPAPEAEGEQFPPMWLILAVAGILVAGAIVVVGRRRDR